MSLLLVSFVLLSTGLSIVYSAPQIDDFSSIFGKPKAEFRSDYTYAASTDTFYKKHSAAAKWTDAVELCKLEGGQLAVPLNETDAMELQTQIGADVSDFWLGIHSLFADGIFTTTSGIHADQIYTKWDKLDTDCSGKCVTIDEDGFYHPSECESKFKFICTVKNKQLTLNTACQTYDSLYFKAGKKRCYKFHPKPKTWHEAFKTCQAEMAFLGFLNSEAEADIFIEKLEQLPEDRLSGDFNKDAIHLDFSDFITPGVFKSHTGITVDSSGYNEWSPGEPADSAGRQCGSMLRSGKLQVYPCGTRAMFMCERELFDTQ